MNLFSLAAGRRTKWLILAGWLAAIAVLASSALDFVDRQDNRDANYLPQSAESLEAIKLETTAFGDEILTGLLVYHDPKGISRQDKQAVAAAIGALHKQKLPGQLAPPVPYFFKDGKTAAIYMQLRVHGDENLLYAASDRLRSLGELAPDGTTVRLTGQMGLLDDSVSVLDSIDGKLLAGTLALITLLLLLIYRSPFLWMLPLVSVGMAEFMARGFGTILERNGMIVTTQAASLMTVLIFGVGTDYALLLIARYREELRRYEDRHEAMRHALAQSGPPIFASAATVAAALLCLSLADVNATSGTGPLGALGIFSTMLAMLTALPALLLIVGRPAFWPFVPRAGEWVPPTNANFWARLADRIAAHPTRISLSVFAVMVVMACGLLANPGGLDLSQSFHKEVESVQGQRLLERVLPPGATGPVVVLTSNPRELTSVLAALKRSPDIASVGIVQQGKGASRVEATLKYPPYSDAAIAAIPRLRADLTKQSQGSALVSGATAIEADSRHFAAKDNRLIMPLALLVVTLVLILLLRSLVAPLVLMVTVIASFLAILGASYVCFDLLFGFPGVDEYIPLFVFIFLVALGVDYNIFLMARVREEVIAYGPREGMRRGLIVTGGVITSAGVVLAGTFLVLAAMPITMLTEIGFAIALGVLFDALVVRTTLVPALGFIFGRTFWWPSPLSHAEPTANRPAPDAGDGLTWVGPPPSPNGNAPVVAEPAGERPELPELPDWTRIS